MCEFYSVLHSIKTKWELKMSGIIKAKKEMEMCIRDSVCAGPPNTIVAAIGIYMTVKNIIVP